MQVKSYRGIGGRGIGGLPGLRSLAAAVLVLDLFVIGITAFDLVRAYDQERQKTVLLADNLSRDIDDTLSHLVDEVNLTLMTVSQELERQLMFGWIDQIRLESLMTFHDSRLPETVGLRVTNAQGRIVYAVSNVEVPEFDVSDREYYTALRDRSDSQMFVSEVFVGRVYRHRVIVFSRRYRRPDGSFAGIVSLPVAIDRLSMRLSQVDPGLHGRVMLWDGRLELVAFHSRTPTGLTEGLKAPERLTSLIQGNARPQSFHARSLVDGTERIYFYRRASHWPMYVLIGLADSDWMAPWWHQAITFISLAALFVLASAGALAVFFKAVRAWQASEDRYHALFEHMQTGFTLREMVTDGTGRPVDCRFLAVNQAFLTARGLRAEEVVGRKLTEIYPDTDKEPVDWIGLCAEVARTGRSVRFETYGRGSQQWKEVTAYRTGPMQVAVLFDDVTERKEAEQRTRKALQETREKLRQLAMDAALVEERERQAIAADLHDDLGQMLHVAGIKLDVLNKALHGNRAATRLVGELAAILDLSSEKVRSLISQISPSVLKDLGFLPALRWLADEMERTYGLVVTVEDDGAPKPLSPVNSAILFRVVRELLINVHKHADTDRARVSLAVADGALLLAIEDDGIGIADRAANGASRRGFGLSSVRERIMSLNGTIEIGSAPGQGTTVTLTLPFEPAISPTTPQEAS